MPIKVELAGIWEVLDVSETTRKNLFDAVLVLYGVDINEPPSSLIRSALHYGVYRSDFKKGKEGPKFTDGSRSTDDTLSVLPLGSYSYSPNDQYRTSLEGSIVNYQMNDDEFNKLETVEVPQNVGVYENDGRPVDPYGKYRRTGSCPAAHFIAGFDQFYTTSYDLGMYALYIWCCPENWFSTTDCVNVKAFDGFDKSTWNIVRSNKKSHSRMCPPTRHVTYIEPRCTNAGNRRMGITMLKYRCAGGSTDMNPSPDLYLDDAWLGNDSACDKRADSAGSYSGAPSKFEIEETDPYLLSKIDVYVQSKLNGGLRYRGITALKFFFAFKDGPTRNFVLYDFVWEGSKRFRSAAFATAIFGTTRKAQTEREADLSGSLLISGMFHPVFLYGRSGSSQASFAAVELQNLNIEQRMPNYSILTADNIPSVPGLVAGVIHPELYPVDKIFSKEEGYDVSEENGYAVIDFKDLSDPIIIAAPMWFSDNSPSLVSSYALSIQKVEGKRAFLNVGEGSSDEVGFSFLALSKELPAEKEGIVYGRVDPATPPSDEANVCIGCKDGKFESETFFNNTRKMVRITFDSPFEDIPSVIITPEFGQDVDSTIPLDENEDASDPNIGVTRSIPIPFVEEVSAEYVLIKSYDFTAFDELNEVKVNKPVPFHFVVVGPPRRENSKCLGRKSNLGAGDVEATDCN